jgi:hypothetical protein
MLMKSASVNIQRLGAESRQGKSENRFCVGMKRRAHIRSQKALGPLGRVFGYRAQRSPIPDDDTSRLLSY